MEERRAGEEGDLNSLIPTRSGWNLTEACRINDGDEIIGIGTFERTERAFLMRPVGAQ